MERQAKDDVIQLAYEVATSPRHDSRLPRWRMTRRILGVELETGQPLAETENGPIYATYVGMTLRRLAQGRAEIAGTEGGGPVSKLEAWMQSRLIVASAMAVHEYDTGVPATLEQAADLTEAIIEFSQREVLVTYTEPNEDDCDED
jgi:hypothetical protein